MAFQPELDGPIDPKLNRYPANLLASSFLRAAMSLGWLASGELKDDRPQIYDSEAAGGEVEWIDSHKEHLYDAPRLRTGTWVDREDPRFGHALCLTRPKRVPDTVDDFTIESVLLTVDRQEPDRHVVGEPKILEIVSLARVGKTEQIDPQVEGTLEVYDKDDLMIAICITRKIREAVKNHDSDRIDGDVMHGIMNSYFDGKLEHLSG